MSILLVRDMDRAHRLYELVVETGQLRRVEPAENEKVHGEIKHFLIGPPVAVITEGTREEWRIVVSGELFRWRDVRIRRTRIACFDIYMLTARERQYRLLEFNRFSFLFRKIDPTWDELDDLGFDAFYRVFQPSART